MEDRSKEKSKCNIMTTFMGIPIYDDDNSLTIGERGKVLLEDSQLINKLASFNRERIPERVVHAKGAGAHGFFKCYKCMKDYTMAKFLSEAGKVTPTFVRFSTVIGQRGAADTLRDPRGFAVKFYTEEGNYDLVGINFPVFFIRDAIKFPDMIHAFKPDPERNIMNPNNFWDFIANSPESTHMITWLYSDRGTIKSFKNIEGYGVHTFVWVNAEGKRTYVKYRWIPKDGIKSITREEAEMLAGIDPDVAIRDMYDTLDCGKTMEYELNIQMMDPKDEFNFEFEVLDATKMWPEDKFPWIPIGKLVINRSPNNFFEESEQVAFAPSVLVPGIELSADKLLQGRSFAYTDTQRHRLGTNFTQIPINRPIVPVVNNERDGKMAVTHHKGSVNYKPNSINDNKPYTYVKRYDSKEKICGVKTRKSICKTDDFKQAGDRYRSLCKEEQDHLLHNILSEMDQVDKEIKIKLAKHFTNACEEFGRRFKEGVGLK